MGHFPAGIPRACVEFHATYSVRPRCCRRAAVGQGKRTLQLAAAMGLPRRCAVNSEEIFVLQTFHTTLSHVQRHASRIRSTIEPSWVPPHP